MSWNSLRTACLLALLAIASSAGLLASDAPQPPIVANDNRVPAGELRDGVLTIHLEIAQGRWHPESDDGEAVTIYAFGETGKALQNPGPLIRVPQGTEIHATLHNALPAAVNVHGLHQRPVDDKEAITLGPGATREVRFKAGAPGTYYYWATTGAGGLADRERIESQLSAALIVDPPGAKVADRVFVIGVLEGPSDVLGAQGAATINGKSWPYTERFTFSVGETVHWRWVNISDSDHAMHLHGFYYHLDAVGDGETQHSFEGNARPLLVTRRIDPGETFDMTWVPERAGRWLFHCHMLGHMSPNTPKSEMVSAVAHSAKHDQPEVAGMGGLVLGITVLPDKTKPAVTLPPWKAERKLQLLIDERKSGQPRYALEVRDPAATAASSAPPSKVAPALIGPPIVLTRGEPVEIEVVNHLKQPTAIHWHGIELESYYDGVPAWTGTSQQTTPAIAPGGSFVARMIPPRAGTFIYHTHWHDEVQLTNGIYGPLIVLPPGEKIGPNDKTFLYSLGDFEPFGNMLLVNGVPQPLPLRLKTGTKYRFRFINIAPNNVALRVALLQSGTPVQWRIIAKDGADLPPAQAVMIRAESALTVGETYDFEYEASSAQELELQAYLPGPKIRMTQTLLFAPARPAN
jgi:FtsP/CotA-like multicopper oxidase with cupredoxin domain